ncbi:MAG TPA: tRNA pseudouridine(38-40) synthase TruA [Vicinamibacterales bacterium]|nr:tRNA pseudouridine(38-40) synthase TruA [Vicinamibacterales bacterium]
MRTFKLIVSYDGTDFSGFQRQSNARSVQADIETALASIAGKHVTVTGAGRTDSGVHALGQVISFTLELNLEESDLLRALNANLPEDVRVLSAEAAAPDFSARFSARSKMYRYRISNTRVMSPFQRRFAWHVSRALDMNAMNEAARELLGEHDFGSFQGAPTKSERSKSAANMEKDTTRTVTRSVWTEEPLTGGGRLLIYEVEGTGFLKYMVRAVVGTLVEVGDGRRTLASVRKLLQFKDRGAAGPTAPPAGLYLVRGDSDQAAPVSF